MMAVAHFIERDGKIIDSMGNTIPLVIALRWYQNAIKKCLIAYRSGEIEAGELYRAVVQSLGSAIKDSLKFPT